MEEVPHLTPKVKTKISVDQFLQVKFEKKTRINTF